jgi:hypothetical protein
MISDFIKNIEFTETKDSNKEYHSHKEYIGSSGLKLIKKSPLHFIEEEKKETEAMQFGSAYHTFILEEEIFEQEYFVFDETEILKILISEGAKSPRATNKYKDWKFEQEDLAGTKTMLDLDTFNLIKSMKNRLMSHRYVRSLLSNGEAEKSIYTDIETFTGQKVKVKIRPDHKKNNKRIITDLKSCADASVDGFPRHAAELDYHIQAALYSSIMEAVEGKKMAWSFFFIAQEKVKPFAFNIFEASPQFISQGNYEWEQLIMLYQWCLENNKWPGDQVFTENKYGINVLNLPAWNIKEINWFDHENSQKQLNK